LPTAWQLLKNPMPSFARKRRDVENSCRRHQRTGRTRDGGAGREESSRRTQWPRGHGITDSTHAEQYRRSRCEGVSRSDARSLYIRFYDSKP
jgi:hypothetical protein